MVSTFQSPGKDGWVQGSLQDPVESSLEGEADGGSPNTRMAHEEGDQSLMISNYKNRSLENDYLSSMMPQGQSLEVNKPAGLLQSSIADKQTQNTSNIKGGHADQSLALPTMEASL
jgi:hypothetical protein